MDGPLLPGNLMVILELLNQVKDPEIPVLGIVDLGIIRQVEVRDDHVTVAITPTYLGCPAMDVIRTEISRVLAEHGYRSQIRTTYSPPWTTDMISEQGKVDLAAAGIAPPGPADEIRCPRCQAGEPRMVSEFSSTACKALLVCSSCAEPFHLFKELP